MGKKPRESPWSFYTPPSFRHWIGGKMNPMAFDKADKRKFHMSIFYLLSSAFTLHYFVYKHNFKKTKDTVKDELSDDISTAIAISQQKNPKAIVYTFDNFKLRDIEHHDHEEHIKQRQQNS